MTIARLIAERGGDVIHCDSATSVRDAIALLAGKRIGALPVLTNGEVSGIFSERDIVYRLADNAAALLDLPVGTVMTSPAVTVEADTPVLNALSLMTRRRIRHLPVVQDGRMIAFVSIGDLVKYRIDRIESEAEALRSYIQSA